MNDNITLSLPHELLVRVQAWADHSGRPIAELLAESLECTFAPFPNSVASMQAFTDEQVLEAVDRQLNPELDQRLSQLLQSQQNSELSVMETEELHRLMTVYHEALLARSAALREAVRRGLRDTPVP